MVSVSTYANDIEKCAEHIKAIVCLVDSPSKEGDRYKDGRTCLVESSNYVTPILKAYEHYPGFVQTAICDLKKIYIERSFFGPAWSALAKENDLHSGLIGLRQKELDSDLPISTYTTWFEQQSFGAKDNFEVDPKLPRVKVLTNQNPEPRGVAYMLLHEVGHIFDYQQKFNDETCLKDCKPDQKSWTAISWNSIETPKPFADFPIRKSICINNCQGKFLKRSDSNKIYNDIYNHGFISQLATLNAMEDFAESFAVYVSSKYMNIHYEIHFIDGVRYNLDDNLKAKKFEKKLKFLESHFNN
jgi:hypothetical protein